MIEKKAIKFVPYLKSVIWGGEKIVEYKRSAISDERSEGSDERLAMSDERLEGSDERLAMSDQRSAGSDERSAISDERSEGSDERSAISDERSAGKVAQTRGDALVECLPHTGDAEKTKIGESWEISAVPGHESVVAEGPYKGMKITELIECFGPELLGTSVFERYDGKFPLLVKIIDAQDNLSVQVHPDDALAKKRHDSLGKTEMWYIIDADKGAKIYSGLNRQLTPEEYVKMVEDNTIEQALAVHESHPGDVFFLPAGRVHAIGAGNLLAEIQESSDITYRIYDYDRRDAQGNPRELHTELAKDAIDYTFHEEYKSAPADPSVPDAVIAECGHFKVDRLLVDGEMEMNFDDSSFTVVMCIEGAVSVERSAGSDELSAISDERVAGSEGTPGDQALLLRAGETVLVPAAMTQFTLKGKGVLLTARS